MIKFISLLKRRQGLSFEDFIDYYENKHVPLGKEYVREALHYQRRFLRPAALPTGESAQPGYDCILEIWFENQAKMDAAMARLASPDISKLLAEDEGRLFDRDHTQCFFVETERTTHSIIDAALFV